LLYSSLLNILIRKGSNTTIQNMKSQAFQIPISKAGMSDMFILLSPYYRELFCMTGLECKRSYANCQIIKFFKKNLLQCY